MEGPSKTASVGRLSSRYKVMDDELALLAQRGDERATETLIQRYRYIPTVRAHDYFLAGADHDDTIQEGLVGLFKAVRDFRPGRGASFKGFAHMCVARSIISAVKTHARKKHSALSASVPLQLECCDDKLVEQVSLPGYEEADSDPLVTIIRDEDLVEMYDALDSNLSYTELMVVRGYLQGKSYAEISTETGFNYKAIDNAMCRAKVKMRRRMRESA